MTYSEAFPLWVAEVYRNHGYEPVFGMKLHRRETEGR